MNELQPFIATIGVVSLTVAAAYGLLTLLASIAWCRRKASRIPLALPAVTVLKPLCGIEPGLYENLRSFCVQDYPGFQLVFGVGNASDPALGVVERLVMEFPTVSMDVVIDPQQHGHNRKISSLINMLKCARHDVLVLADSDVFAGPGYLTSVTAPLADRTVGLVTCLYHGRPTSQIWSRLGAMYFNEWYLPSVLLAWLFGHQDYVSGQTLCIRRETLQAIGGLRSIANHLADDYQLGQLVRNQGLRIVMSSYMLTAEHHEPTLESLVSHELRWMRTLYVLRPLSVRFIFCTFSLPLALFGLALGVGQGVFAPIAWALFAVAVVARLSLHFIHRVRGARPLLADLWLIPVRDLLLCWVWFRSFFTSRFTWRGSDFSVEADGTMRKL